MKKQKYVYLLAMLPFLVVAVLYEIIPLSSVIGNSFIPDGGTGFSLENYETVFTKLLYQKAITNSLKISLTSAVIGMIIAFLGARAIHENQGKLSTVFQLCRCTAGFCVYDPSWKCGFYGACGTETGT